MNKYLWVQAVSTELPSILIRNGVVYKSSDSEYDNVFLEFDKLRRRTNEVYQDNNITISNRYNSYYITGNFIECDLARRRVAFNFYIEGVEKEKVINELKGISSLAGYTMSLNDIDAISLNLCNISKRYRGLFFISMIVLLLMFLVYILLK